MQLTPRYGDEPVLTLEFPPDAIAIPAIRQRQRLAETLRAFGDDQWLHASRCAGWSNRDVIVHLHSTNVFWSMSIAAGLRGSPTTFLATFDPVASPAQLVDASSELSTAEAFDQFATSTTALCEQLAALAASAWTLPAEAPPGHISISAVAHHALWDSWIHERDIVMPLGLDAAEEADEVAACLRYAAALGPALSATRGTTREGRIEVRTSDPQCAFIVELGSRVKVRVAKDDEPGVDLRLDGRSVDLLESLSMRTSSRPPAAAEHAWMLRGVSATFDLDT